MASHTVLCRSSLSNRILNPTRFVFCIWNYVFSICGSFSFLLHLGIIIFLLLCKLRGDASLWYFLLNGLSNCLDLPPFLFALVFSLMGNDFLNFPFYVIFHIFLKLPSLKLPAEVTIMAKDKDPPTAQDGFEISLLSRIWKNQERNPKRLFYQCV